MKIIKILLKKLKGDNMKISGSILKIYNDLDKIEEMIDSGIDYLHLDVMDGLFVENISLLYDDCDKIKHLFNIPLDIHLMVQNPIDHIKKYINFKPKYITFHIETEEIDKTINYLKNNEVLVGLAINPNTSINKLLPYLDKIDLVLVMSVEPGYGGQEFINSSLEKLEFLKNYKNINNLNYLIEIDGGINKNNIKNIDCDIVVIGSGITNSDNYKLEVSKIKELL